MVGPTGYTVLPLYGLLMTYGSEYPSELDVLMMYDGDTFTIGMPMTYANIQKRVIVWVVPCGTPDDVIKG